MSDGMKLGWRSVVMIATMASVMGPATAQAVESAQGDSLPPLDGEIEGASGGFERLRKPPIPVSFLSSDGGWIQFQYPPSARERVGPLIAQADDLRAELADILGQAPLDGVEVRVARGWEEMTTLAPWATPPVPQSTGISYPKLRLMVLSLGATGAEPSDLGVAFRRELARMALGTAVDGHVTPPWLSEGFAAHFSRDATWTRALRLYRLVVQRRPNTSVELDAMLADPHEDQGPIAVAESADWVGFLLRAERRSRFGGLVGELRRGEGIEEAVRVSYGSKLAPLERRWASDLGRRATLATLYAFVGLAVALLFAGAVARLLRRRRARMNQPSTSAGGPAVSSDRERVHIVFSRRDERIEPPILPEAEIPKVEHEGEWHTLH
jgi:hypothetical protein